MSQSIYQILSQGNMKSSIFTKWTHGRLNLDKIRIFKKSWEKGDPNDELDGKNMFTFDYELHTFIQLTEY